MSELSSKDIFMIKPTQNSSSFMFVQRK